MTSRLEIKDSFCLSLSTCVLILVIRRAMSSLGRLCSAPNAAATDAGSSPLRICMVPNTPSFFPRILTFRTVSSSSTGDGGDGTATRNLNTCCACVLIRCASLNTAAGANACSLPKSAAVSRGSSPCLYVTVPTAPLRPRTLISRICLSMTFVMVVCVLQLMGGLSEGSNGKFQGNCLPSRFY